MRPRRRRCGGSAVEQALVVPVLLVLLVAGFEYGWTMFRVHQIEAFARQAGRIAAATPVDDDPEVVFTTCPMNQCPCLVPPQLYLKLIAEQETLDKYQR